MLKIIVNGASAQRSGPAHLQRGRSHDWRLSWRSREGIREYTPGEFGEAYSLSRYGNPERSPRNGIKVLGNVYRLGNEQPMQ